MVNCCFAFRIEIYDSLMLIRKSLGGCAQFLYQVKKEKTTLNCFNVILYFTLLIDKNDFADEKE